VILSGCVSLLPTSTLPKPKADGATAICCEYAADGRILRRAKIKRKGAQGLTKPKLVTVHTYAVRHSAQRGNGGALSLLRSARRGAKLGRTAGGILTGLARVHQITVGQSQKGKRTRVGAVRFPERGGLPGQEGLEGPWALPSALFWLKKFYPVVNEKLPHRPTASLHRRILGISVFVVRNYLTAIYDEIGVSNRVELALWYWARKQEGSPIM
jgi:hypothetical protein